MIRTLMPACSPAAPAPVSLPWPTPLVSRPGVAAPAPSSVAAGGASFTACFAQPVSRSITDSIVSSSACRISGFSSTPIDKNRRFLPQTPDRGHPCRRHRSRSRERRPDRLANIALLRGDALMHAAVSRNGGEYTSSLVLRSVDEHRAVGSVAWRLIETAVRQHACRGVLEIHHGNAIRATVECHHRELLAVGRKPRTCIVGALERDALRAIAAAGTDPIDLRRARAVG